MTFMTLVSPYAFRKVNASTPHHPDGVHSEPRGDPVKPNIVGKLEEVFEQAIAKAFESKKLKKLPVKPRKEITHLMAKAAVAVYEGVAEGRDG